MSADSAVSIAWDLLKWAVTAIKRPIRYVMSSKSFADSLQEEVQNLDDEVRRVNVLAEQASNNVRKFHDVFTRWEKKSDDALKEVRDLLGDFENATKTCCYGTLPDPKCRYQFSRRAEGKIKVIKELAQKYSGFKELNDISYIDHAPGNVTATNLARREGKNIVQSTTATASSSSASTLNEHSEDGVFESRAAIIGDIMGALADNSNSVVGVYGMGGVGKSTLLVDVERRIKGEKQFDLIAKADVSENPDIKMIQGVIAHALGLHMKDYEYESVRADRLRERLGNEKRKVLIILDNLWKGLDLKLVGIPCGHDNKVIGCKLLLTSRDRNVLQEEMGCDKDFLLDMLKEKEAKILFERMVRDKVHNDEFRPLVDKALRKCAGLPLLIVAMGKHLKHAPPPDWRDALNQIELSTNEGISGVINEVLQLSYHHLKSKDAKSLLQLCVAYGVYKPSIENLVRYGYGWGIFREDSSIENARDRLSRLIHTLQASSLLLDNGGADDFKIHDLVRDFVARFILRDRPLLVLKDEDMSATQLQNERFKTCSAICFPYIYIKELPKELDCPELRIFLLFNNNISLEIPDSFFNSMKKLAVLHLSSVRITHSPTPFQFLENLHTLCLQHCSLEDEAILSKLKGLQVLSCVNSNFQQLPKEIGQLTELRLLDLNHCSNLQIIEPGVLGRLIKLEELYMENSFNQWNFVEQTQQTNASLIELNYLKNLCTLHVSIPNSSVLPEDLDVKKLTKYKMRIGNATHWSEDQGLRILYLKLDPISDVLRKGCIQSLLSKTDNLFLAELNGSKQNICALSQEGFPKLKHLQVKDSLSIHHILQWRSLSAFETLESLLLINLINLTEIWPGHISSTKSFSRLKVIRVQSCDKMEVLFPLSLLRGLTHLEEIEVVSCKLLCGIVVADDCGKMELQNLRVMKLQHLPNIKNFFTAGMAPSSSTSEDQVGTQIAFFNGQQVAFPSLETLHINDMDNIEMIWDNQAIADSFPKLKSLFVVKCNKFVTVVTSYILGRLLCLESLTVKACASLEVVFELQPPNPLDGHRVALLLRELKLSNLPNLKCIWDKEIHCQVKFQCLHSISVSECKSLTSLFPASVARDLIQLEELEIYECGIVELIEKEEGPVPRFDFPKLTSLKLELLIELKCIYTERHALRWPALKTLEILGCNKVEILALQPKNEMPLHKDPLFFIEKGAFPSLQELKLDLSERMEIWHRHFYDGEFFNKLRFLELRHLSRESSISTSYFVESLPNLEELVVCESYLEDPRSINEAIEGTSHELKVILPFSRYIQHLKTLDVSLCDGLSNMLTRTIAENLVALTKLKISNCRILTEVISDEEGGEGHVVAFNQLKYMELDRLARLRCFSSGGYTLMFPLLEDIIVNGCPKMKFFFEGPMEVPKLERVRTSLNEGYGATKYQYFWKANLNTTIQNMFKEMATLAGTKFMRLSKFPELIGKWHSELNPFTSSWQLESLVVDRCPSFINAIPSSLMLVLERMRSLQVHDCELLEEIFNLEELEAVDCIQVLPQLEDLYLVNLPKLRRLWNRDLQGTMCFNSLRHLSLYKCSNLRHAFVPSMARCLPNLWHMEIKECDRMEGVIVDEEGQGSAVEEITFPNLKWIYLEYLPNLNSFLSWENHMLECPVLLTLSIAHCPKMRSLTWQSSMEIDNGTPSLFTPQVQFPQLMWMDLSHMDNLSKIWTDGPQETLTFDYLWEVEVQNCKSLENLFPYWVATSLTQLEKLQVQSCEIEEIVDSGDDTPRSNTTQHLFPKLTSLVLRDMPRLKSFCPNLPTLNWPLLKELRVTHCDKLNMLSFVASMNSWAQRDDQQDLSDQEAHSSFGRDFPNFERLLLVNNTVQMIQDGNFPNDIFSKPIALTLACFHDENAIFPSIFLLERFRNLQSLEVFCSSFEDIFSDEGLVEEGKHPVLENLREIKLNKLHNLKRVWREDSLMSEILHSIETFEIWDCPCLMTIFPIVTSFQNLTKLVVKNSSRLVHLVTVSAVTNLMHLNTMTIIGCERMKEVVANDGNREGKVISFGNLHYLALQDLPSLECFSSISSCIFRFPCLRSIEVEECPKMKIFSKGTLSTPQLCSVFGSVRLFRYQWKGEWEEGDDLNTTIQKLSA